jgi:hypothetical protein
MPIKPDNDTTAKILLEAINTLNIEGTEFRAWKVGEKPQRYSMKLYFNSDHDGLSHEHLFMLLHAHNPELPSDYKVIDHQNQFDKGNNPRGRLFRLDTGPLFYTYCRQHNFELIFTGDRLSCYTDEDRSKMNIQKRKTDDKSDKADHNKKNKK